VDHLPLAEPPLPTRATLTLLVGRVTTIKLAYWASLAAVEAALPYVLAGRAFAERLPSSIAIAATLSVATLVWAFRAARARDRRLGTLHRSIPTVATTFAATTVVASPASLPLLIVERERSLEACGIGTCHVEALWLWVAILIVGTVFIPLAFAVALKPYNSAR
jgi:amino acid transporter